MKKVFVLILALFFTVGLCYAYVVQATVSVDNIPKTLFGSWQVEGKLIETNAPRTFKPQSIDLWNLSRVGNVLKLENPFTGAVAEVGLQATEGNLVVFTKQGGWDNRVLKDVVSLRLEKETFTGINDVVLEIHSLYDGHILKKETARYRITGKKLAGTSIKK